MTVDPYCLPGGRCLRNKLEITDPDELRAIEGRIAGIRDVELAREILPGEHNLQHYQQFHWHLFRDVYDWAGELRQVDITKGTSRFAHWRHVGDQMSTVLAQLVEDNLLIGRNRVGFLPRLAFYYGELNALHPFREGNGRALRAFLRQVAAAAGWRLDWTALDPESNVQASQHSLLTAETTELVKALDPVVVRM